MPRAVAPPSILPAAPLVIDRPGQDDVFPPDAPRVVGVLLRLVATIDEVDTTSRTATTIVELHGSPGVELPADLLRFGKRARGTDLTNAGKEEGGKAYERTGRYVATSKKIRMPLISQKMSIVASS